MKEFEIEGKLGASKILTCAKASELKELVGDRRAAVITDDNVARLYKLPLKVAHVIDVRPGEDSKSLDSARSIYMRLMKGEMDRGTMIVGFGGGVVCDLAGFVASTYLRGIPFGFVPTTLLSQVDAAIGGKNGVNLEGYKNLVGTFTQPEFVLCDIEFLKTLPAEEMREGMAEALKAGAIADAGLFELIERTADKLSEHDEGLLAEIVERAVAVKVKIVNADERESGARRLLNFGHTFGHALERTTSMRHGTAIAAGMIVAANLSVALNLLAREDAERLTLALRRLGLATSTEVNVGAAIDAVRKDKKRYGDSIEFVLLDGIGSALTKRIKIDELAEVANDLRKHL